MFREANRAADWLAKWAMRRGLEVPELESPLQEMLEVLEEDACGEEFPRSGGDKNNLLTSLLASIVTKKMRDFNHFFFCSL